VIPVGHVHAGPFAIRHRVPVLRFPNDIEQQFDLQLRALRLRSLVT
jgi:hypothetical protein